MAKTNLSIGLMGLQLQRKHIFGIKMGNVFLFDIRVCAVLRNHLFIVRKKVAVDWCFTEESNNP